MVIWDTSSNFWELNPGFKLPFKEVYKSDHKKGTSSAMWVIALYCHYDSIYSNMPIKDRLEAISETLNVDKMLIKELVDKYQDLFFKVTETPLRRMLRMWKDKLEEKIQFISDTEYKETTWEMLDKMQANYVSAYKQWEQITKDINKDKEQTGQSDAELSLTDKNLI